jgi:hypothetical protein
LSRFAGSPKDMGVPSGPNLANDARRALTHQPIWINPNAFERICANRLASGQNYKTKNVLAYVI